jgi:hypothetical protein
MKTSALTSADNYFEDFTVGALIRHARSKTITEMDNVLIDIASIRIVKNMVDRADLIGM